VGTSETIARALDRSDVNVTCNPDFLALGNAVDGCLACDRNVVYASSDAVVRNDAGLHGPVGSSRFNFAGLTSADPIMYAVGAYRAIRFAFVN
jgi:UDP-glucose 6-dehydrogenase